MANIKFFRKGNYVVIEDSVTGLYHEEHASNVYVKKKLAADTSYYITLGTLGQYILDIASQKLLENKLNQIHLEFLQLAVHCTALEYLM